MSFDDRDRQADLLKLADAFFDNLERDNCEYGGWGIDDKRPFGSSYVEGDILDIIGLSALLDENGSDDDRDDAERYAADLYADLGDFLSRKWAEFRK